MRKSLAMMLKLSECFYSEAELEQRRINSRIEKMLRKQKLNERRSIKLLLLGTGESGKSTFIKQMKIIHGEGFTKQEKQRFKKSVFQNIIGAIETLTKAMQDLNIPFEKEGNEDNKDLIKTLDSKRNLEYLGEEVATAVVKFWADQGVKECYRQRNKYQLPDSVEYFFNDIWRIAAKDYVPNEQDILHVRTPTNGIVEYSFEFTKTMNFRFVDVAGQRGDRKKWIHCFEDVTSVIFLVATSEYDQNLRECADENRMEESKALFKTIAECKWIKNSSIILFLNKIDLLEEKIQRSHLADHFPEFQGPQMDANSARIFIRKLFVNQLRDRRAEQVYTFYTCATDTDNIRKVFQAVKDTVLIENLKALQLYNS